MQGSPQTDLATLERKTLAVRAAAWLARFPWLIPALSFGSGWLGFVLVKRGEGLARLIAALALVSWVWLLLEPLVRRSLERRRAGVGKLVANFLTQSLQQEMLFFSLPFILGATQRDVGQIGFTALAIAAAVLTTLDPIYEHYVAARAGRRMLFQAYCSVIAAVVVMPMVVHLPVERALPISLLSGGAWLLLTLPLSIRAPRSRRQTLLWIGSSLLAPLGLWLLREHVPPAGLVVTEAVITQSLENLTPGPSATTLDAASLRSGVIAFAAVRAPMGLSQSIVFEWRHAGHAERIVAEIHGGNRNGFRTYARKRIFPADAQGRWTVDILTPQRQLLQRLRFDVTPDP
jgi:hypothetical protein